MGELVTPMPHCSSTVLGTAGNGNWMADSRRNSSPEAEWIQRCQDGDREAFGHLVDRHRRRVFSLVYHILHRHDELEDVVQEIFIKGYLAIRSYNFQASFGTWLSRIAVNHCYDYLRRQRASRVSYYWQMSEEAQQELEGRAEKESSRQPDAEQQAALKDLIHKLLDRAPADDRIILALKELEGLSIEEIAEILKIRTSNVKVRLHRARKRMLADMQRLRQGR
jgi:RNA polymerase sigma-70 factor (ECF subfamily)